MQNVTGHDLIKQLREMEQHATPGEWAHDADTISTKDEIDIDGEGDRIISVPYDEYDLDFIVELRNNADLLLSIAEAFRPGDYPMINIVMGFLRGCGVDEQSLMMDCMRRLQAAAARLEE